MARPAKRGLDYFPKDVDFYNNFKIADLLDEYGPLGVVIYEIIISMVYRNGYYLEVPLDVLATQLVRIIGNRWVKSKSLVLQVILYCADIGLFEKGLLNQSVITSVGIQRRYSEVTVRNKVDKSKYWLIENNAQSAVINAPQNRVSVTETPISATKIPISATENTPKESKLNEIKLNERPACTKNIVFELPATDGIYQVTDIQLQELQQTYKNIDVMNSFKRMYDYFQRNPRSQRSLSTMRSRILVWLNQDNENAISSSNGFIFNPDKNNSTKNQSYSAGSKTSENCSYDLSVFEKYDIFE